MVKASKHQKIKTATIFVFNYSVQVTVGDILILSPNTFGNPNKLEYSPISHITNDETDDPEFQIRTIKHDYDFQNFYNVVGALRPTLCDITIQLFNLVP